VAAEAGRGTVPGLGHLPATLGPLGGAVALAALGTGFCGALTTYSTFSYETFALIEGRDRLIGVVNVVGSVLVGVAAATAGWAWGQTL
jgi:CrcB protein